MIYLTDTSNRLISVNIKTVKYVENTESQKTSRDGMPKVLSSASKILRCCQKLLRPRLNENINTFASTH